MKTALTILILLNVILGCLVITEWNQRKEAAAIFSSTSKVGMPTPPVPVSTPVTQVPASTEIAPFRWSQLDAKDYHIYVKNLRATGCPEPTVRAIVTADVDSVYQIFAIQLEQKLSALENGAWSNQLMASSSEPALKQALQRIPDEEAAKIADLLGLKPAPAPGTTVASATPAIPIAEPLVMENVDLSGLNLDADQKQMIVNLQQNFLQEVGDTNQAQSDPARWQRAQNKADNLLMAGLGYQTYNQYQLRANEKWLENNNTN